MNGSSWQIICVSERPWGWGLCYLVTNPYQRLLILVQQRSRRIGLHIECFMVLFHALNTRRPKIIHRVSFVGDSLLSPTMIGSEDTNTDSLGGSITCQIRAMVRVKGSCTLCLCDEMENLG